jgi:hypothetical protein
MRLFKIVQLACGALLCCSASAYAEITAHAVNGRNFRFPVPVGFCTLNPNNSNEAAFAKQITTLMGNAGNTVAEIAADCQELIKFRSGSANLWNFMIYYYPSATEKQILEGDPQPHRHALCDDMRNQTDATVSDVPDIVAKTARELKMNSATDAPKYLGVLAEDSHGCYSALLQNVRKGNETHQVQSNILATVVHGKTFYLTMASQYKSAAESEKSLVFEKAIAADFDANNPN